MPAVQQPAELASNAGINAPMLPDCSVTQTQGHRGELSPRLTATSQGSPADTRDENSLTMQYGAELCLKGTAHLWVRGAALGVTAAVPPSPCPVSLLTCVR